MSPLLRRTLIGVGLGAVVYAVALLWFDAREVSASLSGYTWSAVGIALAASSVNYVLRFWKWELCLGWLDVRAQLPQARQLSLGRSFVVYIAGLSMSVTPGKLGEVLRSVLLKASNEVPVARTAPIVIADRATDLIALVLLSLIGVAQYEQMLAWVVVTAVLVAVGVFILGQPRIFSRVLDAAAKLPGLGRFAVAARGSVDASAQLLRLGALLPLTAISVVGWGLECVGFWFILDAFVGVEADLPTCAFAWAATTIVGALSFLPGGLGATELSLGALIPRIATGASASVAVAATMLIRACTLWFGVVLGGLFLIAFMRDPAVAAAARNVQAEPPKT